MKSIVRRLQALSLLKVQQQGQDTSSKRYVIDKDA
jgi:hypothetical protein